MNLRLEKRTALVCGSTQGIGFAIAQRLAGMGCRVILVARNLSALEEAKKKLPGADLNHGIIAADFSDPQAAARLIADSIGKIGNVHVLVNNSGGPPSGAIAEARAEEFIATFNQHLLASHLITQLVLPGMKQEKFGRIINVISTSVKQPLRNLGVSNTIRAAVANWAKTLAGEVAPYGITVNNVLPGATSTLRLSTLIDQKAEKTGASREQLAKDMLREIPAGRFAEPAEVAAAAAFLASEEAGYITGINLPVDGGRTMCL